MKMLGFSLGMFLLGRGDWQEDVKVSDSKAIPGRVLGDNQATLPGCPLSPPGKTDSHTVFKCPRPMVRPGLLRDRYREPWLPRVPLA